MGQKRSVQEVKSLLEKHTVSYSLFLCFLMGEGLSLFSLYFIGKKATFHLQIAHLSLTFNIANH